MKKLAFLFLAAISTAACAYEVAVKPGPRVLHGVVTAADSGWRYFFIYTKDREWWRCSINNDVREPEVGDVATVRGQVLPVTVNNRIDHCDVEVEGRNPGLVPVYEGVTIAQLNEHPVSGSREPDRFGRLVATSGKVVDVNRRADAVQLILSDGGKGLTVTYRRDITMPLPEGLAIGGSVRVKGVYVYVTNPMRVPYRAFESIGMPTVMVCNENDLEVLTKPPFWTPFRAWVAVGLAGFVGLGLLFWVVSLRRTVSRQVALIEKGLQERAAQDGARRERLRLSHDLHDDFQQLLSGTMFRITAALNWLAEGDSGKAAAQLEKASANIIHTQSQLRAVLWGLQEESEGPGSLIDLFRYAAGRMAHWEGIVHIESKGRESPLARTIAGGLLMILQEAVGNAIRHGKATRVDVLVAFGECRLGMKISDNGTGFDTGAHAHGLGLGSMEERAKALGGVFIVESRPGEGATITTEVPL